MKDYVKVVLKSGKDQSLKRFHPWVFSGAIKKIYGEVSEGDIVKVYSNKEEYLGTGHYQIGSISIRIFTFEDTEINTEFWHNKIKNAVDYRHKLGLINSDTTNVFRIINAEGDNLPGLIVDYYNGTAVFQIHSIGMFLIKEQIAEALINILGNKIQAIYDKSESTLPFKSEIKAQNGIIYGKPITNIVSENSLQFHIDWEKGQKTGFFIDQRENRNILQKLSANKRVLNIFGYTGGFSVYAIAGNAKEVYTVDSSARAIDKANENISLNFNNAKHAGITADAFDFLENNTIDHDIVILDPPAFAKHRKVLHNALQGYKKLNRIAFEKVKSGTIIFTFSCSQVVSKENFKQSIFVAAANTGRKIKIMHQLTQPADHPVNIFHPEGEYLKGLVIFVE